MKKSLLILTIIAIVAGCKDKTNDSNNLKISYPGYIVNNRAREIIDKDARVVNYTEPYIGQSVGVQDYNKNTFSMDTRVGRYVDTTIYSGEGGYDTKRLRVVKIFKQRNIPLSKLKSVAASEYAKAKPCLDLIKNIEVKKRYLDSIANSFSK